MRHWGIQQRLLFLTLVPGTVIALLLATYYTFTRIQDLDQALQERGEAIVRQLAPASEFAVFSGNRDILSSLANAVQREQDVRAVAILNDQGTALVGDPLPGDVLAARTLDRREMLSLNAPDNRSLWFRAPIIPTQLAVDDFEEYPESSAGGGGPDILGHVYLQLSRDNTLLKKDQVLLNSLVITLLVLSGSAVLGLFMARGVTRPVKALAQTIDALEKGRLETRVELASGGELETLAKGLNMMAAALKASRDGLEEQIDEATRELRETLDTLEIQNAELAITKKEAQNASRIKSEFLANTSHEIRTPLNGILGYTNLLLKSTLSPSQREYAVTIRNSATALLGIVNDILDFSKIEADRIELENIDFDLRDCIEDVLDLLAPTAQEKGLELVYHLFSDLPPRIHGDPTRLRQVLVNLVSNAVKFTRQGSVTVQVKREEEDEHQLRLRFSVSDTGIGLSLQERRRLFRAFSQADTSATRKFGGTGLGLVIAKKLVEKMHGQLAMDSVPNQGTTVNFTVLCEKPFAADNDEATPRLTGDGTVILVEPHPTTRLALREILERWGLSVRAAASFEDLLKTPQDLKGCRLVIAGGGGRDPGLVRLRKGVERLQGHVHCPVLILAATVEEREKAILRSVGASLLVPKPVRYRRLLRAVEELLAADGSTPPESQSDPQRVPKRFALNGVRILIAEDNEINSRLVTTLLRERGAEVSVATDGREALDAAIRYAFDVILMDVHMPEMDGATVTTMLRGLERGGRHTPVIALTADAMVGNRQRFISAGMDDYLEKPIDEALLFATIERWMAAGVEQPPADTSQASYQELEALPVLDEQAALVIAGGRTALVEELLGLLLRDLAEYRSRIQSAEKSGDTTGLRELAHKLAGGAAQCAALALEDAAQGVEQAMEGEDQDTRTRALENLYRELDRLERRADHGPVSGTSDPGRG